MDPVAVRRKADGLYLDNTKGSGGGRFTKDPRFIKSEAKAKMLIRVDLGRDLKEFDILPRDEVLRLQARISRPELLSSMCGGWPW